MAEVGVFLVPDARDPERTVEQAVAADEAGLDLVAIQDHPYQRRFLDTFTLLAHLAGVTSRVRLAPDVANLPLRPPAMLAKAAASIDVLSGGRFELGLGAGSFWDNIAAMGGPAREPGESVDALEESIEVLRLWWSGGEKVSFDGEHYALREVKPDPRRRIQSGSGSAPMGRGCSASRAVSPTAGSRASATSRARTSRRATPRSTRRRRRPAVIPARSAG